MRALIVVPVVVLFGCAHEESERTVAPLATAAEAPPGEATASAAPPPASTKEKPTAATCPLLRVHFAFDSDVIPDDQKAALDQAASCLQQNHALRVSVEGNTDFIGPSAYNEDLGQRRAQSVTDYLRARGVSPAQLSAVSFGEQQPVCVGDDPACLARNRATALRPTCHL